MVTAPTTQTITRQRNLQRYIEAAQAAGVARDQLERFVAGGYVAQPHQLAFHAACRRADRRNGPEEIGFGGARGPGKTHAAFAQVALDDCQRFPGLKVLFLRKIAKAAKSAMRDLRMKVLGSTPHEWSEKDGMISFPNGSFIVLGHFKDEKDVDQYIGIEYDLIVVEEATTLTKEKIEIVHGSKRTSKPGWRPRMYLTTNPGGIGHQWFRSRFILPWRNGTERETCFVPGRAAQNRYINREYNRWLSRLSGTLGRLWRDGDWDAAGGQFFTQWRDALHVVDPLESAPAHWRYWLSMDYGYTHYTTIYLFGQDDDGMVHILDEHAAQRWLIGQHAGGLDAMLERNQVRREQIATFVAGHDVFAKKHDGSTIASAWESFGWYLQAAQTDRINGAAEWAARLGNPEAKIAPSVQVSRRCAKLIECMPGMLSDPKRPEDVLKIDCDEDGEGGDDPYDGARYGLMEARSHAGAALQFYKQQLAKQQKGAAHA